MKKRPSFYLVFYFCGIIASAPRLYAQAGVFDHEFGNGGQVLMHIDDYYSRSTALAVQPDSRILVGGIAWIGVPGVPLLVLARLLPDGTPDSSFGTGGKVKTLLEPGNSYVFSAKILVQPDGKIIQAGTVDGAGPQKLFLVRYHPDGTLDEAFGTGGKKFVATSGSIGGVRWACLQPDGKIVVSSAVYYPGTSLDVAVFRLLPNGSPDNTFGGDGEVVTNLGTFNDVGWTLALQPDGKIVIGGHKGESPASNQYDLVLLRYLPDGNLDNTFGTNGIAAASFSEVQDDPYAMLILPDGSILLTGAFQVPAGNYDFVLIRFKADGAPDAGFGDGGFMKYDLGTERDIANCMLRQPDGKIVLAGNTGIFPDTPRLTLLRLNADYAPDSTFGINGILKAGVGNEIEKEGFASDIAFQPDGKIVIAGDEALDSANLRVFCALRVLAGINVGVPDLLSPNNTMLLYPNPACSEVSVEYTLEHDAYLTMTLRDINGRLAHTWLDNAPRKAGTYRETLPLATTLLPGTYILSLDNGTQRTGVKIVKQ